ncbi:MAG: 3-oxoacyl-[acyl-carrier-protein] reductase [Deferribacterota bacterium]|nr:3-oxoacyl-[acyl-carrier-protein] reductase [Deferribacterota bacterium]
MTSERKVVLVTGGSRGIGREIALNYGKQKYCVVVNYISNKDAAEEVAGKIKNLGGDSLAYSCDVSNEEDVKLMVRHIIEKYASIDILVNNAGITRDAIMLRLKENDWQDVIDVNLKGAFLASKYVSRYMMKKKYGYIINISSVVAYTGNIGQCNYIASKSGLIGLTRSMALELSSFGIRVNTVVPGFIKTDMTSKLSEDPKNKIFKNIPLGYIGEPKDISKVVEFLTSGNADYITGQAIHVNGGLYMN